MWERSNFDRNSLLNFNWGGGLHPQHPLDPAQGEAPSFRRKGKYEPLVVIALFIPHQFYMTHGSGEMSENVYFMFEAPSP